MFNLSNLRAAFGSGAPRFTAADAIAAHKSGEIIVIDVRNHDEVARTGKAKGAIHIPLMQLQGKADPRHPDRHPELRADKPIAVYCASGARSGMAQRMLHQFGYETVHNIGGFGDWMSSGGAVGR